MDLDCGRELQAHRRGVRNPIHLIRSPVAGSELPRCDLERTYIQTAIPFVQTGRTEREPGTDWHVSASGEKSGGEQSRAHLSPYASAAEKVRSYRGDSHLLLLVVEWGVSNPATP